ncbi:hypothetical protein AAV35_012155 [Salimicrobium jeotgali]|uniref:DUF1450 domain-containing protein n=2 Tax=Salimicrobium TaxID=351195 RepID=K2GL43_9BACI|nr:MULTISPECIES: DUF1450 domain-containing protein [Salimicrobium]AKG05445.1 hypothetical protein AAV35_012155 [Salimicrobium jeotgali]EKE31089.1 hypothetical protein MJ3_10346 [Salimicrobium jeotgali]MBM7697352.1 uncharacterized protein YuzB (UPF0349 family) [Salimicrobium jeotgali]PBB05984.1 DUF1450 domain-containing protein [Salimicrobium humidisoli]
MKFWDYNKEKETDSHGVVLVEICDSNLLSTIDAEGILEEEYPAVDVLISDCLSYCGLCAIKPYALVNNKRVFGHSAEQAMDKIRKQIDEELAAFTE